MQVNISSSAILSWFFGIVVLVIGMLNIILIHPVPGVIYILLSLFYFPPVNLMFREWFGIRIPTIIKIILGVVIIWFTLGVSDLGDLID